MKYCIYFTILFFAVQNSAWGQIPERGRISNIDTATIIRQIEATQKYIIKYPDSARVTLEDLLFQSRQAAFDRGVRNALFGLITIDYNNGRYPEVLRKVNLLLGYCDSLKNHDAIAVAYYFRGAVYRKQSRLREAFDVYAKAASFAPDSLSFLFMVYHDMGDILQELGQYQKALSFFDKSITLAKASNNLPEISIIYTNKGKAFEGLKQMKKSEQSFDSAILFARKYEKYSYLISALSFKANLYNETQRPQKALSAIEEAESISKEYNVPEEHYTYMIAGDVYFKLNQLKAAEDHYLKAKEVAKDNSPVVYSVVIRRLSDLYFVKKDYKKAYLLSLESYQILDTIVNKEVKMNVNALETKYRTAAKDKEIAVKNLKISESEKEIAQKNNTILSVVLGSVILLMISLLIYIYQKRKIKSEKEIEHLKGIIEGEEKERTRLAHDLHDGINSQLAAVQSFLLAEENTHPFLAHARNFNAAQKLLLETASGVRRIAHNLAPEGLLVKGLPNAIKEFCNGIFTDRGIKAEIEVYGDFNDIHTALSLSLYRIIQELTQNIVKHSGATEVTILLYRQEEQIILIAEDNGTGIPKEILQKKERRGIGLSGLEERIKMHHGTFSVDSAPSKGTTIHITFPVNTNFRLEPSKV